MSRMHRLTSFAPLVLHLNNSTGRLGLATVDSAASAPRHRPSSRRRENASPEMNEWESRLTAIAAVVVVLGAYDILRSRKHVSGAREAVAEQRAGNEEAEERKRRQLRSMKLNYLLVSI